MSSDCFGIEQTSDGVVITGFRQPWGRFRGAPWTLNVKLTGDRYSRESVGELIAQVLLEIQNPGEEFTIEDPGTPEPGEDVSAGYAEVAAPDGKPSASAPSEAAISADAFRYASVSEFAPHCFAQAEVGFHAEVAAPDGKPSASAPSEAAISADAFRYASVSEFAPHFFAQAEVGFHNLTVVRREGDETELLIRVAGGAGAHFTLLPAERNALVAALMAPA